MQAKYATYQAAKEAAAIGFKRSGGCKRKSTETTEPPALPAKTTPEEMNALKQLFAEKTSPVSIAKAIKNYKNEAELQGMRKAHLRMVWPSPSSSMVLRSRSVRIKCQSCSCPLCS